MRIKLIVILTALLFAISLHAQSQEEACLEFLHNYNDLLENMGQTVNENALAISYTISNQYADKSGVVSDNVKMLVFDDKVQYSSQYMDIFQDTLTSIVVLKSQRILLINNNSKEIVDYQDVSNITMIRDSILTHCNIRCNDTTTVDNVRQKVIQLTYDKSLRKSLNIANQKLFFNMESGLLEKLITSYVANYEYCNSTIVVHEMNFESKKKIPKTAIEMVLAKNNQPLAVYKHFKVLDNRTNINSSN